jgi:hypothetical protein
MSTFGWIDSITQFTRPKRIFLSFGHKTHFININNKQVSTLFVQKYDSINN